jgi:hypothetical protein
MRRGLGSIGRVAALGGVRGARRRRRSPQAGLGIKFNANMEQSARRLHEPPRLEAEAQAMLDRLYKVAANDAVRVPAASPVDATAPRVRDGG